MATAQLLHTYERATLGVIRFEGKSGVVNIQTMDTAAAVWATVILSVSGDSYRIPTHTHHVTPHQQIQITTLLPCVGIMQRAIVSRSFL